MSKEHAAASQTLLYAREVEMDNCTSDAPMGDYAHLVEMCDKMASMESVEKRNRYLGWIQCAVYSYAAMNVLADEAFERMKSINRDAFGK